MAQIINRKTPEIISNGRGIGGDYVTVMERGFFFSKGVSRRVGIYSGKFIHFVNDGSAEMNFIAAGTSTNRHSLS